MRNSIQVHEDVNMDLDGDRVIKANWSDEKSCEELKVMD